MGLVRPLFLHGWADLGVVKEDLLVSWGLGDARQSLIAV